MDAGGYQFGEMELLKEIDTSPKCGNKQTLFKVGKKVSDFNMHMDGKYVQTKIKLQAAKSPVWKT